MAKDVSLPKSNLYLKGFGKDVNGNAIIKLTFPNKRGFSIQTGGALPNTYYIQNRLPKMGIEGLSQAQLGKIEIECVSYIRNHGSDAQKKRLRVTK